MLWWAHGKYEIMVCFTLSDKKPFQKSDLSERLSAPLLLGPARGIGRASALFLPCLLVEQAVPHLRSFPLTFALFLPCLAATGAIGARLCGCCWLGLLLLLLLCLQLLGVLHEEGRGRAQLEHPARCT